MDLYAPVEDLPDQGIPWLCTRLRVLCFEGSGGPLCDILAKKAQDVCMWLMVGGSWCDVTWRGVAWHGHVA